MRRRRDARPTRLWLLPVLLIALLILGGLPAVQGPASHPGASPVAPALVPVAAVGHPTRASILLHLDKVPGNHFNGIVRGVGKSVGVVRHHLNVLKRGQWIREVHQGQRSRYYAERTTSAARNRAFETIWAHQDTRLRVLQVVSQRGVVHPSQVAGEIGISRQLATYHLTRLAGAGQIHHGHGTYSRRGWSSGGPVTMRP